MHSLDEAIDVLNRNYHRHIWDSNPEGQTPEEQMTTRWPGRPEEDIVVSVHKDAGIFQKFHRHDFFFINFALEGDFEALSQQDDRTITIREGQAYMAQPYSGYAVTARPSSKNTIAAILIQRTAFFREFFSVLSSNPKLFHFFLDVKNNRYSESSLLIDFENNEDARRLVEFMIREYAFHKDESQPLLKSLVLSLLLLMAREIREEENRTATLADQLTAYISTHYQDLTLEQLSRQFSYHPNYISGLLRRETGQTFSELLLQERMKNAIFLLKGSKLPVDEVADLLGYANPSNFYKAFKACYGMTPRQYLAHAGAEKQN